MTQRAGPGPLPWGSRRWQGQAKVWGKTGWLGRFLEHFRLPQVCDPTGSSGSLGSGWAVPAVSLG